MPTDEIFDDEFMNEMLLNPDLYGLEDKEKMRNILSGDDIEDQDDFETWQRFIK